MTSGKKADLQQIPWPSDPSQYQCKGVLSKKNGIYNILGHCLSRKQDVFMKIKQTKDTDDIDEFVENIKKLINIKHSNLLTPVHAFVHKLAPEIWVIYPRRSGGPLIEALIEYYPNGITDESIVASILYDICVGLHHLHGQEKCHRNICASSIHIDIDTGRALLSEFHQLKEIPLNEANTRPNSIVNPSRHPFTDPLILFKKNASWYAGDIYSLGMTALQLAYGSPPPLNINIKNLFDSKQAPISTALYQKSKICSFSKDGKKKFDAFIKDCCCFNLEKRISIEKLISHKFFTKRAKQTHIIVKQFFGNKIKSTEKRIVDIEHPYGFIITKFKTKSKTKLTPKEDDKIEQEEEKKNEIKVDDEHKSVTIGNLGDKISVQFESDEKDNLIITTNEPVSQPTDEKPSEDLKNDMSHNELDTDVWLRANGLECLTQKMKQENLTIKELLLCGANDIRDLCNSEPFKCSVTIRIKLIAAIKSMHSSIVSDVQQYDSFDLLGRRETQILATLYKQADKISNKVEQLQRAINVLEKSAVECTKEVDNKCDMMIKMTENKRNELLNIIIERKNKMRMQLDEALIKVNNANDSSLQLENKCKEIAAKTDISSSVRIETMNSIVTKQRKIESKTDFYIDPSNVKLMVQCDEKAFNSNLNSCLWIDHYSKIEILKFSPQYMSDDGHLELSDDYKCVTHSGSDSHTYILADIQPVTNGVHCWRVQVTHPTQHWLFWGISSKKLYAQKSYYKENTVQGVAVNKGSLEWYLHNNAIHNNITKEYQQLFLKKHCQVDMLLDVDKGTLNLCVVGHSEGKKQIKICGLSNPPNNAWVPHFNLYSSNTQLRIAKIPVSLFGKHKKNIF
eukprot:249450_1